MQVEVTMDDHGAIRRLEAMAGPKLDAAVKSATSLVSALAVAELAGPDGLTKFPAHAPHTPTPASPGGPPAQVTGALVASIFSAPVTQISESTFHGAVGVSQFYGRFLEPKFPFLERVKNKVLRSKQWRQIYLREILRVLREG